MNIESDIKDIKQALNEVSRKLDELVHEKELDSIMKLSEKSLNEFLEEEPDIYRLEDLKVRYNTNI
ncbi:MAG: hypothetical protein ACOC5L_03305 [Halobacteriota archaeon]